MNFTAQAVRFGPLGAPSLPPLHSLAAGAGATWQTASCSRGAPSGAPRPCTRRAGPSSRARPSCSLSRRSAETRQGRGSASARWAAYGRRVGRCRTYVGGSGWVWYKWDVGRLGTCFPPSPPRATPERSRLAAQVWGQGQVTVRVWVRELPAQTSSCHPGTKPSGCTEYGLAAVTVCQSQRFMTAGAVAFSSSAGSFAKRRTCTRHMWLTQSRNGVW
jgi:hypothetical protein